LFVFAFLLAPVQGSAEAAPLLQVDFGAPLANSALQSGMQGMWGTNEQPTTANFGPYTVQLSANSSMTGTQSSRGFFFKPSNVGGRIDNTAPSIRDFYRDFYFNRSTINGEGIDLKISGLTPNAPYSLTLASFDADASLAVITKQEWGPKVGSNTTGTSTTIEMLRDPVPTSVWDPAYSGTIQVSTATGILDIFGTTSAGARGAVLNGFKLNDGVNDVLSIDLGEGAEVGSIVPGFHHMTGPNEVPMDFASQVFGSYTVSVERVGGSTGDTGFYNEIAARMGGEILPPATNNMFRDCFYNVSAFPGDGVKLTIDGVTPNTEYDLTIWDMDPALPTGFETPTTWEPVSNTSGQTGTVINVRSPVPQTIDDPNHLVTIRVKSTTSKLEIFGTTTSGFGGVRLNAFSLSAVVPTLTGDYNEDGKVDGADYVMWRNSPDSFGGVPDGYNTWRANFGASSGTGMGGNAHTVPEPATLVVSTLLFLRLLVLRQLR